MTGQELHKILKDNEINFAELAKNLKMTPQALNNRFSSKDVSVKFLQDVIANVHENVYELKGVIFNLKPKQFLEERVEALEKEVNELKKLIKTKQ